MNKKLKATVWIYTESAWQENENIDDSWSKVNTPEFDGWNPVEINIRLKDAQLAIEKWNRIAIENGRPEGNYCRVITKEKFAYETYNKVYP